MLICQFVNNSPILEVIQVTMSFTKTHFEYWYCDTKNWTRSMLGKKDEKPTQPMTEREIEWAKKYYLPKAQATAGMASHSSCSMEVASA